MNHQVPAVARGFFSKLLVSSLHDTSTKMVEKHYAKYITEHSDDVSRHALLHHDNVVALAR